MELVDLLDKYGANFEGVNGNYSPTTNAYTQVATQDNPDYASMHATLNKYYDTKRNSQLNRIGLVDSALKNKREIEAATTKYERERALEILKGKLNRLAKREELKQKKSLGLGNSLTFEQKLDLEEKKHTNKVDYADHVHKLFMDKEDKKVESHGKKSEKTTEEKGKQDQLKSGLKLKEEEYKQSNKEKNDETKYNNSVSLLGIKHGNDLEKINTQHGNKKELLELTQGNNLEKLFIGHDLNKELIDHKTTRSNEGATHRATESIRVDNAKHKNKKDLQNTKTIDSLILQDNKYINQDKLQNSRQTHQKEMKGIDEKIQGMKSKDNEARLKNSRSNSEDNVKIQELKHDAALKEIEALNNLVEENDNGGSLVIGPSVVDKNKDNRSFFQKLLDKATKKEVENAKEEEKLSQLFNNRYGLFPIFGEEELLRSLGIFDDEDFDDDLLG